MPRYEITAPDGRRFEITAPEGASQEAALAYAKAQFARSSEPEKPMDPTGSSFLENAAIGAGKMMTDTWRGAKQRFGIGDQDALRAEVEESRRLDAPIMKTAGGLAGYIAPALATAAIPGANTLTGAAAIGAGMGALQPTTGDESVGKNVLVGGALGGAGQYAGGRLSQLLTNRTQTANAAAQTAQGANAARDAALATGQAAGYVVPPTQANPTLVNRLLEGFSGKLTTAQQASSRNQTVTNRLASRVLGLPDDQPITPGVLRGIRQQAGQAYDAIRQTGVVTADQPFGDALNRLNATYQGASRAFPNLARNDVAELMASLRTPQFAAGDAVDAIRVLRETADTAFASRNAALGRAARGASEALEDLLERHAAASGAPPGLVDDLRNARTTIARTYTVERALNPATGTVNAQKLAQDLRKGRPLTNELRTVAEFSEAFPKATQPVERMGSLPGSSPLDWALGGTMGAVTANPLALASVAARPTLRSMILSGPYQAAMTAPAYNAPRALSLAEIVARGGRAEGAGRLLAPGYFATVND